MLFHPSWLLRGLLHTFKKEFFSSFFQPLVDLLLLLLLLSLFLSFVFLFFVFGCFGLVHQLHIHIYMGLQFFFSHLLSKPVPAECNMVCIQCCLAVVSEQLVYTVFLFRFPWQVCQSWLAAVPFLLLLLLLLFFFIFGLYTFHLFITGLMHYVSGAHWILTLFSGEVHIPDDTPRCGNLSRLYTSQESAFRFFKLPTCSSMLTLLRQSLYKERKKKYLSVCIKLKARYASKQLIAVIKCKLCV